MKNRKTCWVYLAAIMLTEAVGLLAALLTRRGMEAFEMAAQSPLTPPAIVFPIVWTVLYGLMGIGAARVFLSAPGEDRSRGLRLYLFQLVFNFFWSLFFFNLQVFGFAFFWLVLLWLLIFLMILSFWESDRLAALLQIPYLLWVTFAGYLNLYVWLFND